MIKKLATLLTIFLIPLCFVVASSSVSAFDPFGNVCGSGTGTGTSAACASKPQTANPLIGGNGLLSRIANIVSFVAGAAAIIVILVGSIRLITSSGDTNAITTGKKMVIGALVGIVVIVFARILIQFVVGRL